MHASDHCATLPLGNFNSKKSIFEANGINSPTKSSLQTSGVGDGKDVSGCRAPTAHSSACTPARSHLDARLQSRRLCMRSADLRPPRPLGFSLLGFGHPVRAEPLRHFCLPHVQGPSALPSPLDQVPPPLHSWSPAATVAQEPSSTQRQDEAIRTHLSPRRPLARNSRTASHSAQKRA